MSDLISREDAIEVLAEMQGRCTTKEALIQNSKIWQQIKDLPAAQPEIIRCKDCIYGYLYVDVQNSVADSWIECRNPEGLNRDVSVDGYCSASIRRT